MLDDIKKTLWAAADKLRAQMDAAEYKHLVLGLIFLRFAEVRYDAQRAKLEQASASARRGSRVDDPAAYQPNRRQSAKTRLRRKQVGETRLQ